MMKNAKKWGKIWQVKQFVNFWRDVCRSKIVYQTTLICVCCYVCLDMSVLICVSWYESVAITLYCDYKVFYYSLKSLQLSSLSSFLLFLKIAHPPLPPTFVVDELINSIIYRFIIVELINSIIYKFINSPYVI